LTSYAKTSVKRIFALDAKENYLDAQLTGDLSMGTNLRPIIVKKEISLEQLKWKRLAVDANNMLYQFLSVIRLPDRSPLKDSRGNITSHLTGLAFRTTRLVAEHRILPVFAFDGKPPILKVYEIEKRNEIREKYELEWREAFEKRDYAKAFSKAAMTARLTKHMADDAKLLLQLLGIPYVQAPSEAEAQCAYMAMKGDVWAANSRDYDSLLFGAPRLVRYVTISGSEFMPSRGVARKLRPELIELREFLLHHEITREQLIDLAVLIGTDFNSGIRGIGPIKALKLIRRYGSLDQLPNDLRSQLPRNYAEIEEIFLKPPVTNDYHLAYEGANEEGLLRFLCGERDFSRDRVEKVIEMMKGLSQSVKSQRELVNWFDK